MRRIVLVSIAAVLILLAGAYYFSQTSGQAQEQAVLKQTFTISKEYLSLRLETDNILVNAKNYPDYESWNAEMTRIINAWGTLEKESQALENSALQTAELLAINHQLIKTANAISAREISNIYDKAPKFKGIAAIAKHLGVDAKRAQVILDQAQAEITSGVFSEEGNAFEKMENTAIVVKDGCKVAGFVGGVVLTGGAAGFAAAGTMAQVGTVVVGVDLALEVTEDGAQIAFGDRNKVSSFVKDVRKVTEPIASVITITNVPGNLGTAYGKFDSVMVGLEQFREAAQEGKVVGVDLTTFKYQRPFQVIRQTKYPGTVTVAEMEKAEVEAWLQSLGKQPDPMTQAEIKEFLSSPTKDTEPTQEDAKEANNKKESEESKPTAETRTSDLPNQIIRIKNVSGTSWMMDTCFSSTCWDDLAANPEEDLDLGGIYTLGKVFGEGEGFSRQFEVARFSESSTLVETSPNSYKITLYFALAPFAGTTHKTIDYGTWLSESVEINANYGEEPVIEWDGNTLRQVQ